MVEILRATGLEEGTFIGFWDALREVENGESFMGFSLPECMRILPVLYYDVYKAYRKATGIDALEERVRSFASLIQLDWSTLIELIDKPKGGAELLKLFRQYVDNKNDVVEWFLVGLTMPSFFGQKADQSFTRSRSSGRVIDSPVLIWRARLQRIGLAADERDKLEALLYKARAALSPQEKLYDFCKVYERLLDTAILMDKGDKEKNENQMESKAHVNFYGGVGSVNLGKITGNIYSAVTSLAQSPATHEVAESLKSFTDAITKASYLSVEQKTEALEAIETLSEQARLPPLERKAGVFKSALIFLPTLLSSAVSGIKIWETFGPSIEAYFK